MRYLVAFLVFACACGELQPEDPDSKLNSGTNVATNAANVQSNNTANSNANNTITPVDVSEWGTEGPTTSDGKSPDGFALCDLDDVVTEDIGMTDSDEVPADPWDSSPVRDTTARCGDDLETLGWRLHNCERIGRGLQPLQCDLRLVWLAREHTLDMIRQDYFRHDNPAGETPQDRMDRHSIGWAYAAENLAMGNTVLIMHHEWMDSRGHRENILRPGFTHMGLGTAPALRGGYLSTAVFNQAP